MDSKHLIVGKSLFKKNVHTGGILLRTITKVGREYVYVAKAFSGEEKIRKSDLLNGNTEYFESEEALKQRETHRETHRALVESLQEELAGIRSLTMNSLLKLSAEEVSSLLKQYRETISKVWNPPFLPGDRIKITNRNFGSTEKVGDVLEVKEVRLRQSGYFFLAVGVSEYGTTYETVVSRMHCTKVS